MDFNNIVKRHLVQCRGRYATCHPPRPVDACASAQVAGFSTHRRIDLECSAFQLALTLNTLILIINTQCSLMPGSQQSICRNLVNLFAKNICFMQTSQLCINLYFVFLAWHSMEISGEWQEVGAPVSRAEHFHALVMHPESSNSLLNTYLTPCSVQSMEGAWCRHLPTAAIVSHVSLLALHPFHRV